MKTLLFTQLGLILTLGLLLNACKPASARVFVIDKPVYVVGPEDDQGNVLAADQSSLYWLSHEQEELAIVRQVELAGINDIAQDDKGNIWVGTNSGLAQIGSGSDEITFLDDPVLEEKRISSVAVDVNRLWLNVFGEGLRTVPLEDPLSEVSVAVADAVTSTLILDIMTLNNDSTWIATLGEGVLLLDNDRVEEQFVITDGLPTSYVNDISLLGSNLWIGTHSGLARLSNGVIVSYGAPDLAKAEIVYSVVALDESTVLVGTSAGGPFAFCPKENTWKHSNLTDDIVYDLHVTDKDVWVAGFDGLLVVPQDLLASLCD